MLVLARAFCLQPRRCRKSCCQLLIALIHYAAEEAIAAGVDTLIFVTGRNKRAIEDHFDANNDLETMLRAKGKD